MKRTPEYNAWLHMKDRCYNPNYCKWHRYGGRGITVCQRWLHSYSDFLQDMGLRPTPHHSLDRIEVDGNYEPDNCKWATRLEQANNRSTNHYIEHEGTRLSLTLWARKLDMAPEGLGWMLYEGKSIADVVRLQQVRESEF